MPSPARGSPFHSLDMRVSRPCPNCGDSLERIPRRVIDRLAGLWHPVHRYQCRNPLCYWQGNLGVVNPSWGGLEPMVVALGVRLKRSGSALLRHPRSAAVIERARSWLHRR